ncbi:hypothetical protein BKK80_10545 [Cupriavidus malaysiensis]|uniref:Uncharacterized protein n=1 Tax=Cupriavidus malaysiensis TaxID=367825 RepID=A0ABN4TGL7_9BURK|nr:hypothetical protein BKK80_10545 [Cupriavidus malaysiensis]
MGACGDSKSLDRRLADSKHVDTQCLGDDGEVLQAVELPTGIRGEASEIFRLSNAIEAAAAESSGPGGFAVEIALVTSLIGRGRCEGKTQDAVDLMVAQQQTKSFPVFENAFDGYAGGAIGKDLPKLIPLLRGRPFRDGES